MLGKKGQMFLIVSLLIVLFLLGIRLAVEPVGDIAVDESFESVNIRDEFENVQKFSETNREVIANNLHNFSKFSDDKMESRGIDFKALYVSGWINSVSNGTETNLTLTVGNFLENEITNVNITLKNDTETHGSVNFSSIEDRDNSTGNITFDMLAQEKTLNITYKINNETREDIHLIKLKDNKRNIIGVFDLEFVINDRIVEEKSLEVNYR